MKKFLIISLALLISLSSFAQKPKVVRYVKLPKFDTTKVAKTPSFLPENLNSDFSLKRGPYMTNLFWENWFVTAGIGCNAILGHSNNGAFVVNPHFKLEVGKWFTPEFGTRFGWSGFSVGHKEVQTFPGGPAYSAAITSKDHYFHTDFLLNASNLIFGYRQNRVYNLIPYGTAGLILGSYGKDFGYGFGLLNTIRLDKYTSFFVDLQALHSKANIIVPNMDGAAVQGSASVGIQIKINDEPWFRP